MTLHCPKCGASVPYNYTACNHCQTERPASLPVVPVPMHRPATPEKKIPAGICGILLGAFGVHKFILGYTTEGVIMLVVSLVGSIFVFPTVIMGIVGLIEGIIYLTKPDDDFIRTYVTNKRGWM